MQQGQQRWGAHQAGARCTAVTTEQTQTELHFLCPTMYTKTTAGNEVLVSPGTQASPFLAKEARCYTSIFRQKNLGLSLSDHSLLQR